jgi:hypothetical protein
MTTRPGALDSASEPHRKLPSRLSSTPISTAQCGPAPLCKRQIVLLSLLKAREEQAIMLGKEAMLKVQGDEPHAPQRGRKDSEKRLPPLLLRAVLLYEV